MQTEIYCQGEVGQLFGVNKYYVSCFRISLTKKINIITVKFYDKNINTLFQGIYKLFLFTIY